MTLPKRDLAIIVPDKDIEQALTGLLRRPAALGTREIDFTIKSHRGRDPGCYQSGHELLRAYSSGWAHGLIVFDRAWQGAPSKDPTVLAHAVDQQLAPAWNDRARCIVIDPEVEAWVFSSSPHVEVALGWAGRTPGLRHWLCTRGLWPDGLPKPPDPKKAFEQAAYAARVKPSAAVFRKLAETVSFQRCTDPGFTQLRDTLRAWFPRPRRQARADL